MAFLPPDKARLLLYDVYANIGSLGVGLFIFINITRVNRVRCLGAIVGYRPASPSGL